LGRPNGKIGSRPMTIILVVSDGLSVCAVFFSAVFDPISIKLGLYVTCLGLVVSPRI